jgi:hypothetical protein
MQLCVADFLAGLDKLSRQIPKPPVLGDLPLGLLDRGGGNDLGDGLAFHFSGERVARTVTRRIRLGAVTGWFAALAKAIHQGPGPEIVHLGEGTLQPGSFALKIIERWGQGGAPF